MAACFSVNTEKGDRMFGPLTFEDSNSQNTSIDSLTKCILCEDSFNLKLSFDLFLRHVFDVHSLIIEDVQNIDNLKEYVLHWRDKFKTTPIERIIPTVAIDSTDKQFFLLSDLIEDDKLIRHKIKLDHVVKVQEFERTDPNFIKQCLFCRLNFEGTRHNYVEHLCTQHNLQLGDSQNLVFVEDLIDKIEKKLADLKCIYCDKTFPERNVLKEHMRKKLHKRIHPKNKEYDKYYIVNYLEANKSWKVIQKEDDIYAMSAGSVVNTDEEYSDWNEQEDQITCLFCTHKETNINMLCLHMDADHNFDFAKLTENLDFYQKIKLVNYIRKQIHNVRCFYCNICCENLGRLQSHLSEENHYKIPELTVFDQPEYYFPTYENDAFLYFIDDVED